MRIHMHDYGAIDVPSQGAVKRRTYAHRAERALVLAQARDLVVLGTRPEPSFMNYLASLGLGPGPDHVLSLGVDPGHSATDPVNPFVALRQDARLMDFAAAWLAERVVPDLQVYLTGYCALHGFTGLHEALERRLGAPVLDEAGPEHTVVLANRKELMRREARRLGIPVADGVTIPAADDAMDRVSNAVVDAAFDRKAVSGGAIVRGAWSSSGSDIFFLRDSVLPEVLEDWTRRRRHVGAFLVEELLDVSSSPNLQVWLAGDGAARLVGVTGQRLRADGSHFGNVHPYASSLLPGMEQAALLLGDALGSLGYRGPLGVDLVEVAGGERFTFAETNGRMNASTYSGALFEGVNRLRSQRGRQPLDAWVSRADTPVAARDFDGLRSRLGDLLYQHDAAGGVVPYNTGLIPHGVVDLLTLGESVEHAEEIERRALERLV